MNVLFIKLILRYIQDTPLFASFILCEAICEFQDQRKGLTVVLVDAEKAFDRVSHDGLFRKLAALQIPMECWMVLRDWNRDFNNVVKWNGTLSGFSREQLAPSTHNESAPEQCMRCSVQDCMAEMVSTPWCRPRYGPLTSVHGCYTMQSSGASTTQTFWRSFSGID